MRSNFIVLIFGFLVSSAQLQAQSAFLPTHTHSHGRLAVSAQLGYTRMQLADSENRLKTGFLKPGFGLWEKLDLYLIVGKLKQHQDDPLELESGYSTAFGVGASLQLPITDLQPLTFYLSEALLQIKPQLAASSSEISEIGLLERERRRAYRWQQSQLALTVARPLGRFVPSVSVIYLNNRIEISGENRVFVDGELVSSIDAGAVIETTSGTFLQVGFEIPLPDRIVFGLQARLKNRDDFGLFVGLSQVGSPD